MWAPPGFPYGATPGRLGRHRFEVMRESPVTVSQRLPTARILATRILAAISGSL